MKNLQEDVEKLFTEISPKFAERRAELLTTGYILGFQQALKEMGKLPGIQLVENFAEIVESKREELKALFMEG